MTGAAQAGRFAGRSAVVTGGSSGMGRAISLAFAAEGAAVVVADVAVEGGEETVALIEKDGGQAQFLRTDVSDGEDVRAMVDLALTSYGALDYGVNAAAIENETSPVADCEESTFDRMIAVNLRSVFLCMKYEVRAMREPGRGGAIVNIADLAAFETWPAYVPHGITKAGVVQMTRALAHALAPAIRVNAVAPGVVLLPEDWSSADADRLAATTPLRRIGAPSDVVAAVVYLLESDFITGETIIVDGGRHVRT